MFPPAALGSSCRAVPAWKGWGMSTLFLTGLCLHEAQKVLGAWGSLGCRIAVFLLTYVCCSPCPLFLSMEGGWEGLYEPKARNLTLLEQ